MSTRSMPFDDQPSDHGAHGIPDALSPRPSVVSELAPEIDRLRVEAGMTMSDLRAGLRAQRSRYARERYGNAFVDRLSVPAECATQDEADYRDHSGDARG